jgi:hypothetical protein
MFHKSDILLTFNSVSDMLKLSKLSKISKNRKVNGMVRIGYIRISTEEQKTARQELQIQGVDKVYIERIRGKSVPARLNLKR